ncbi:hypothetical protein C1645_879606 [Glomus cerebriforme]|uniref:BED-type domain-containing protein n=1 Tax=Glomus cerebriforme TaxID=658196 RepID=A0A397SLX8_9GLOM|nr:hypothetical protein C1645_879606 [Glomus cerebriforme]
MLKRSRKKKPAWKHFNIIGKNEGSHTHVQCKYCSKSYQRAVPGRMQAHLDKYCKDAPNNAKSQSRQQNATLTIDKFSDSVNDEQQRSFEISLVKALTSTQTDSSFVDDPYVIELFRLLRSSFKLPNGEEIKSQMNGNEQLEFSSGFEYRQQQ